MGDPQATGRSRASEIDARRSVSLNCHCATGRNRQSSRPVRGSFWPEPVAQALCGRLTAADPLQTVTQTAILGSGLAVRNHQAASIPRTTTDQVSMDTASTHPLARITHGFADINGAAANTMTYKIISK